jgi:hypothetical protein
LNELTDIVKLAENVNKMRLMLNLMLNDYQRALVPYLRINVINPNQEFLLRKSSTIHLSINKHLSEHDNKLARRNLKQLI